MKRVVLVIGVVVLVLLAVLALGGAGMMSLGRYGLMGPGMMGGYGLRGYGAFGFGFSPLGTIIRVVSWALLIGGFVLLIVWLARTAGRSAAASSASPMPLDVLQARYARGEITKEQYESMRRDLA